eukprot:3948774-Amphidinium_carterae.2
MTSREKEVYFAKLAEQAERYDEMADHMENWEAQCHVIQTTSEQSPSHPERISFRCIPYIGTIQRRLG